MHNDYDVPPSTTLGIPQLFMASYVVPPPPRPLETRGEDKEESDYVPLCAPIGPAVQSLSPRSSPRPPPKFRNPFEAIELNPPTSQVFSTFQRNKLRFQKEIRSSSQFWEKISVLSYRMKNPNTWSNDQYFYLRRQLTIVQIRLKRKNPFTWK